MIHFLYEIMREAGLRVPQPLSNAVSIVGALVIGETAVSSGLGRRAYAYGDCLNRNRLLCNAHPIWSSHHHALYLYCGWRHTGILGSGALSNGDAGQYLRRDGLSDPLQRSPLSFKLHSMRDVLVRASWKILSKDIEMVQNMPGSEIKNPDQKGKQV